MNMAPDDAQLDRLLETALAAATAGGEVLRRHFGSKEGLRVKDRVELVSDADVESEQVIQRTILDRFPHHDLLGEEGSSGASGPAEGEAPEHLWVVDPLDGTNNFVHGIDHVAVSIAYCYRGRPLVGVVDNPLQGHRFVSVAGRGATENGKSIRVSQAASLDQTMIGVGFYYDRGAMMEATLAAVADFFRQQVHGVRRFGAAALDLCYVASGRYGLFFEYRLSPWDFAAGQLIVTEAGGRVTTATGEPLPLTRSTILASNGLLHDAALEITALHQPDSR
ncbi:MAG TPA: inositol monophosphatase family protein [Pirellulaceae bacterium]|jgi:myo-inositol-1(or 4)-monophosphatase|nr:inositol monophosphatase family protein [Pirellulaceae bacterium]